MVVELFHAVYRFMTNNFETNKTQGEKPLKRRLVAVQKKN